MTDTFDHFDIEHPKIQPALKALKYAVENQPDMVGDYLALVKSAVDEEFPDKSTDLGRSWREAYGLP